MSEIFGFENPLQPSRRNKPNKCIQHAGACVANLSAFAVGNILAWSAPATPLLLKGNAGYAVSDYENSLLSSMVAFGAAVSCLPSGYVADRFGRKTTMLSLVPLFILGWALIIWSTSVNMLYAGRFVLGLCSGIVCVTTPVFTVEICQKEIRGTLGVYYQLLLTAGILFTYVIGSQLDLFWLSLISGMVPLIFGMALIFFPESPVYYLTIGQPEKARTSLKFFRGPAYDLEPELCELAQYSSTTNLAQESICDAFLSKQGIKSLTMSIGMMIFQQLSGVNVIIFYSTSIFEDSGGSLDPKYATIVTGLVQFLTTFSVVPVVDRLGRVVLLGTSALLMFASTFVLGLYFFLKESDYQIENFAWVPLVSLCLFLIVFSVGYGPIPWALMPEMIPSRIKSLASSIACVTNWICAFLVTKFFTDLVKAFGLGVTFWLFSFVSFIGTVFSYKVLPETKGKSFEEIQRKLVH